MKTSTETPARKLAILMETLKGDVALATAINEGVDDFFSRYPELERTLASEAIAAVAVYEGMRGPIQLRNVECGMRNEGSVR